MTDQDFREKMVDTLARIETKLESLPDLREDVDSLKLSRARDRGIAIGISTAVSVAVAGIKAMVWGR
jgi:hypothetical protein